MQDLYNRVTCSWNIFICLCYNAYPCSFLLLFPLSLLLFFLLLPNSFGMEEEYRILVPLNWGFDRAPNNTRLDNLCWNKTSSNQNFKYSSITNELLQEMNMSKECRHVGFSCHLHVSRPSLSCRPIPRLYYYVTTKACIGLLKKTKQLQGQPSTIFTVIHPFSKQ